MTPQGNAVTPDGIFKTKPPKISRVRFTGTSSNPTVTITGSRFGTTPPADPSSPLTCVPGDTSFDYGSSSLWLNDATAGWTAGQIGDCIGLILIEYTNTRISGGDAYTLAVHGVSHSGTVSYS